MKQNIRILTQNACNHLLTFQTNSDLRDKYNHEKFDEDELEFLKYQTSYYIDEELHLGTLAKDDCESSIAIFKQLINLDKVQANDKRLWVCLSHKRFYEYTRKRWKIGSETSFGTILERFHFEGNGIEARMRNSISRLWWAAKITYDETRENNFELTELLWEKQDVYSAIVERSFATYPGIVHGFLEFFKNNRHLKEDDFRALLRGLNSIGGVKVLPLLTKKDVTEEIQKIAKHSKIEIA